VILQQPAMLFEPRDKTPGIGWVICGDKVADFKKIEFSSVGEY
jgi:hypothetical protein